MSAGNPEKNENTEYIALDPRRYRGEDDETNVQVTTMIPLHHYKDKTVAVFGLGRSGEAVVQALLAGGALVVAWDGSDASRQRLNAADALTIAPPERWDWQHLDCLVLGPGVPLTHPKPHPVVVQARAQACRVTGELELFHEASPEACVIGITGTNGKSTTTTLIGHILQQAGMRAEVGGNLGTPMLALAPLTCAQGVYVLELSSYQLDLAHTARVQSAVLLNLSPDHIDRHGDMAGYIAAKQRIFANQSADDTAIISVDDAHCAAIFEEVKECCNAVAISVQREVQRGVFVKDGVLYDATLDAPEAQLDLRDIPTLRGRHNWQNAAVAYAVCRVHGVSPAVIAQSLQRFPGLRHRMQPVATLRGVTFVNDSKATNAEAAAHALAAFEDVYWIAGGQAKEGGIAALAPYFPRIRHAYLIGEAEAEFAQMLEGAVEYTQCATLENALEAAAKQAFEDGIAGAAVLLSPACASFDQWKSFEARGDAFCAQAEKIENAM